MDDKRLVAAGSLNRMRCPNEACNKGTAIGWDAYGMLFADCLVCWGKGYLPAWKIVDAKRLK